MSSVAVQYSSATSTGVAIAVRRPRQDLPDNGTGGQRAARDLDVVAAASRSGSSRRISSNSQAEHVGGRRRGTARTGTEIARNIGESTVISSGGLPMPIRSTSISRAVTARQSTNSCTVILSTRCDSAVIDVARRSNMKPGCSPAAWNRVPAFAARASDALVGVGAEGRQVGVRGGRDDALARFEQRDDVVGVGVVGERLTGRVQNDVGVQRQDLRRVVRRERRRSAAGRRGCPRRRRPSQGCRRRGRRARDRDGRSTSRSWASPTAPVAHWMTRIVTTARAVRAGPRWCRAGRCRWRRAAPGGRPGTRCRPSRGGCTCRIAAGCPARRWRRAAS